MVTPAGEIQCCTLEITICLVLKLLKLQAFLSQQLPGLYCLWTALSNELFW